MLRVGIGRRAAARNIGGGLSLAGQIAALFANNEVGGWYDPSDLTTLFQDSAGTTPVTAVEQPVGLMLDKSKGLALGPELVTNGDFSAGSTGWTLQGTATISGGVCTINSSSSTDRLVQSNVIPAGKFVKVEFDLSVISGGLLFLDTLGNNGSGFTTSGRKSLVAYSAFAVGIQFFRLAASGSFNGSIDNISVRELPGNHAFQSTSAARPVLSARVNLLTKTEQFDDAAWTKTSGVVTVTPNSTTAPDGTVTADTITTTGGLSQCYQIGLTLSSGVSYTGSCSFKANASSFAVLNLYDVTGGNKRVWFNLATGTVGTQESGITGTITATGNGFYRCTVTRSVSSASGGLSIEISSADNTTTAAAGNSIYAWGADLRVSNDGVGLPSYQRVNTSTDYDTTGFPLYLRSDGVDDFLLTNSINFSATDKMTVWAGVRKLSDGAAAILVELSTNVTTNAGSFYVASPEDATTNRYSTISRGSAGLVIGQGSYVTGIGQAPDSPVLTTTHDIAGSNSVIRRNGVAFAAGTASKGTGNFGNYPLYLFRRGGTSLPFNGRFYGLIVRGAASDATQIESGERYLNEKTKAY